MFECAKGLLDGVATANRFTAASFLFSWDLGFEIL